MKVQNLALGQREELTEKSRKKIQALINYGFTISDTQPCNDANRISTQLQQYDARYTLTIPPSMCTCLKLSDMALKLLKPYIKDLFVISQKQTKTNYILFNRNDALLEQLASLAEENPEMQPVENFNLVFDKYTLPTYTNRAGLYSVTAAPTLTRKQLEKVLELHQKIADNAESYFLLSHNISHRYNMPMTVLRILGENVISLRALNVLELLLVYATNSNAIYRQSNDTIKPIIIPVDFFNLEDFELNQSPNHIMESLEELENIGLVNNFSLYEDAFIINSNIIIKSIKQYSYRQQQGYYNNMNLQQQNYVYTFVNYLCYVKNINKREVTQDIIGQTTEINVRADKLTISLEGLLYNLELENYFHDFNYLIDVLNKLQQVGIWHGLLIPSNQPANKELVKYLLNNRDKLHTFFQLNSKERREDISTASSFYNPSVSGRKLCKR